VIRLAIVDGPGQGQRLPLTDGEHVAGREPTCELYLASRRVSRRHARFVVRGDECVVQDMGSANGVLVNGHRMESCALVHGTQVQLGDVLMVFQVRESTDAIPADQGVAVQQDAALMAFGGGQTLEMDLDELHAPGGPLHADEAPPPAFGGFGSPQPLGAPEPGLEPTGTVPRLDPGPAPTGPVVGSPVPAQASSGNPLEQVPWLARALVLMVFGALFLMCGPVGGFTWLANSASTDLQDMSIARGVALAEGLGHRNAQALASRKHLQLDTDFIDGTPGVKGALILDSEGDVVAPSNKMNISWRRDELFVRAERSRVPEWELRDGYTSIIVPIKAASTEGGPAGNLAGFAVLTYDAVGQAGEAGSPWLRWLASAFWMLVTFAVLGAGAWMLTLRPLSLLRDEVELAMKTGDTLRPSADSPQQADLVLTVNRLLRRASGMPEAEPVVVERVVEKVVERVVQAPGSPASDGRLDTLIAACTFPVFLLDARGHITGTNDWGAHLAGLPQPSLVGTPILQVFSEPGASDRLALMIEGVLGGQAPVLADRFPIAGQERQVTLSGAADHMTLVIL
jgi:pSer/pThr/pTyr-binding forkhead associated (FHA) protein